MVEQRAFLNFKLYSPKPKPNKINNQNKNINHLEKTLVGNRVWIQTNP